MKREKTSGLALLAGVMLIGAPLFAAGGMQDTVAQEEAKALAQPAVPGEAAAKAKVEEAQSKELFETKMDRSAFEKEAMKDAKKTDAAAAGSAMKDEVAKKEAKALKQGKVKGEAAAKAKVEEARDKRQFEAKMKEEAFEKEAKKEMKK
jgi:hypothetical protein